jgi:hypothetical protein
MHKGMVLADGRILHNTPFRGEHVCSEVEFRDGKRLRVNRQPLERRRAALFAADRHEPRGYNLLTNNCEHTVHRHVHGKAESPQLKSWLAGIALGALAFAATRHPGLTAAGYVFGRGLGKRL